jgi:hypothetical protein
MRFVNMLDGCADDYDYDKRASEANKQTQNVVETPAP